jgi:lactoylglutathione lyase
MMFITSIIPAFLIASYSFTQTWACGPLPHHLEAREGDAVQFPISKPGDDAPSDPATKGYFINHICINARNATESIDWYKKAFGLRLMFTLQVSEHFSISYMGHSHGGRNGTGYEASDEMVLEKNNREGMLEILNLDYPSWNLPAGIKVPNTFSHIGMVVPNIMDTQSRMQSMGATIIKAVGAPFTIDGPFADSTGFALAGDEISQEEKDLILKTLIPFNAPFLFVADPDGNLIEIQNQDG